MTDPGVATVYRYVSDGQLATGLNQDLLARVNRPLAWSATALIGFGTGFVALFDSNRDSLPYHRGEVVWFSLLSGLVVAAVAVLSGLVGVVVGRTVNRLRMRRLFPNGSVTELRLEQDAVVLTRPGTARTIPFARIRRVRELEHTLSIVVRGRPTVEVLPAGMLPARAVDILRARAVGAVPLSWSPAPASSARQAVVPDGWAAHVAVLTLREIVGTPRFWARLGLSVVVSALMARAGGAAWLALGPGVALVALAATYLGTRRGIAAAMPSGSLASVEVFADRFVSRTARWAREIRFAEVRAVDVCSDVVFLTMASVPPRLVLVRDLVPDEVLERLPARRTGST